MGFLEMTTEIKTQLIAPRIARNKTELDKFLSKNNIRSLWPPAVEQLPSTIIEGLPAGSYNPTIIRHNGKLVMVSRFHPNATSATKLTISELDEQLKVISNQELDLNDENSCEDARLFEFKGGLWMLYVSSTWPNFPASQMKCVQLSKPDKWRVSDSTEYWLPDRQTNEKNHVPIVYADELHVIYKTENGEQTIYNLTRKQEIKSSALRWPYGEIRGGCVIPWKENLLRFFHSSLRNEPPTTPWQYAIGCAVMESNPPFKMLAISRRPILRGSEIGGDESRHHHKKKIVFASGVVMSGNDFLLSVGINDSQSALVKIQEKDLQL
jgi:predicted GH43/DUF377 family glycosyl hydrolase